MDALEQPISTRYLSLPERERIADILAQGDPIRTIARDLGRNPGSIGREIKRNSGYGSGASAHNPNDLAGVRINRSVPRLVVCPYHHRHK